MASSFRSSLARLQALDFVPLQGKRVGLVSNQSAVGPNYRSTYEILSDAPSVNLVALFAPEHGFAAAAAEGEKVRSMTDQRTGIPVYSLYGDLYRPTEDALASLDVIICDIQDIGVRFYTYIWTVSHVMEAAGEAGVEIMILDRPNPLGGEIVAGPSLDAGFESFVGRYPIPVRHGMTLGELARLFNKTWNPHPAKLSVVRYEGKPRAETSNLHAPSSPNMPNWDTLVQYPGSCLLEGTNLSEGRGTTMPFQIVGAPWVNGYRLAEHLRQTVPYDVAFRVHSFRPQASKWAGAMCNGVQVYPLGEAVEWPALEVWLSIIREVRHMYPDQFAWLQPPENSTSYHFDRLIGSDRVRMQIDDGATVDEIASNWPEVRVAFMEQRQPYLIYEA